MANYNTVITNEGAALLASVIANQGTLTLTEMRFSTNDYSGSEATLTYGTFSGVFITAAAAGSVVDSTTIKAASQFDNRTLVGDNPLYSIGLVGTDGNTTALIAVSTTTAPDIIRPAVTGVSTYAFNMNLTVSSTNDITVAGTTAAVLYDVDVVDTLISTATDKPLSANQGRVLEDENKAVVNVYGAKNQLPYPYYQTTRTYNDITFTDVGDGPIIVSGVASGGATFYLTNNYTGTPLKQGVYKVNGCPINGGATSYRTTIEVYDEFGQTVSTHYDEGAGVEISVADNQSLHLSINVFSGVDLSTPITFKPMIYDARILDPTYAPPAKTNLQLTNDKAERSDLATLNLTGSTNSTGSTITAGTYFYLNGSYCKAKQNIMNGDTFTLNTNFEVVTVGGELENKLNLVKVAESASGTDTFRNKLNALYNAFNALSDFEKTLSFIVSYGTGVTPMKFVFGFDKRFGSITRQDASITSGSFITLDSSNSVFSDTVFNTNNTITATDNSTNSTPRQFYLYTFR